MAIAWPILVDANALVMPKRAVIKSNLVYLFCPCSCLKSKSAEDDATVVGDADVLFEHADDAETDGEADGEAGPETVSETDAEAGSKTGFQFGTYVAEAEAVIGATESLGGAGAGRVCEVCVRVCMGVGSKFSSDDATIVHKTKGAKNLLIQSSNPFFSPRFATDRRHPGLVIGRMTNALTGNRCERGRTWTTTMTMKMTTTTRNCVTCTPPTTHTAF